MTLALLVTPSVYLVLLLGCLLTGRWRMALASFALFMATLAAGVWAINRSYDSSAWGHYFTIPTFSAVAGMLVLGYVGLHSSALWPVRQLAWVVLLGGLAIPVLEVAYSMRRNREIERSAAVIAEQHRSLIERRRRLDAEERAEVLARPRPGDPTDRVR